MSNNGRSQAKRKAGKLNNFSLKTWYDKMVSNDGVSWMKIKSLFIVDDASTSHAKNSKWIPLISPCTCRPLYGRGVIAFLLILARKLPWFPLPFMWGRIGLSLLFLARRLACSLYMWLANNWSKGDGFFTTIFRSKVNG